jgi:hypothetical protein
VEHPAWRQGLLVDDQPLVARIDEGRVFGSELDREQAVSGVVDRMPLTAGDLDQISGVVHGTSDQDQPGMCCSRPAKRNVDPAQVVRHGSINPRAR